MYITKITKKGQITIPAEYRKKLNAEFYSVEIRDNEIIIRPVKSLAGSLKDYAKTDMHIKKIIEEEKKTFTEALIEKHNH